MTPLFKKIIAPLMVLTLAFGAVASTYEPAEAGHRGRFAAGVAAGIIGLGVLGAVANAHGRRHYYRDVETCYEGPEHCGYTKDRCHYNSWGDYVCRRGEWRCWRETVCD
jgi:hypothetical protein